MEADLVEVAAPGIALAVCLDEDQRDALGAGRGVGLGDDDDEIGMLAVGDVGLGAVEDIMVAVALGGGADALEVGAGAGLGHGDRGRGFAGDHPRQPVSLLLLRAVGDEIVGDDVGMEGDARGRAGISELLVDDRIVAEIEAGAAIFLRNGRAEQAGLAGLVPEAAVDDSFLFPAV